MNTDYNLGYACAYLINKQRQPWLSSCQSLLSNHVSVTMDLSELFFVHSGPAMVYKYHTSLIPPDSILCVVSLSVTNWGVKNSALSLRQRSPPTRDEAVLGGLVHTKMSSGSA